MSLVAPVTNREIASTNAWRALAGARWLASGLALLSLVLAQAPAVAQQSVEDDPFAGVEEMVVVGSSAASLIQNQEVSAIAFDSDYLEALGADSLADIAQFTPNLEIRTPFAASNPTLFIRGVGLRDFNANSSSSVAVYNDEIYMNSPAGQLAQLFDVGNVDVLRGPQATMYARNASAGTIRVLARKPTFTPGVNLDFTYGRFNQVDVVTAVENVIIPDTFGIRTAFKFSQRDGTTRNRCADPRFTNDPGEPATSRKQRVHDACYNVENTSELLSDFFGGLGWEVGTTPSVKNWVNDVSNWGARTILRYQGSIGDVEMDWVLNFHGGQNRGDARQFQMVGANQNANQIEPDPGLPRDINQYVDPDNRPKFRPGAIVPFQIRSPFDGNPYEGDYNNVEKEKLDLFGTSLVGTFEWNDFTLTSVTGYEWNQRNVELNLDANPYIGLEPILTNDAYQVTQELRLDWDDGGGLRGQIGGMYLYESLDVFNTFKLGLVQNRTDQTYSFLTRYGAIWGSGAWEPNEVFKVEAGMRFNYEDKEIDLVSKVFNPLNGEVRDPPGPIPGSSAAKESGIAGDVTFTYSPIEDVSFYLRYAHGWKGPHINGGVVNPNLQDPDAANLFSPVKPEQIDSVEFGIKSRWWEQRITANAALFSYDYQDIQVFQLRNTSGGVPVQQLINADDADVLGVEFEVDVKPFEGWGPALLDQLWVHVTFAWLDSKYTDFVNTQTVVTEIGSVPSEITLTEDFTGNRLINSPEYSFIGFAAWPIGGEWGALIPRFDWSYKDQVYFSPANSELISQDPLWLLNLRLTYKSPSENFEIAGWIANLTDQRYTVDVFNLARLRRAIVHAIGDPRTYGVSMKVSF